MRKRQIINDKYGSWVVCYRRRTMLSKCIYCEKYRYCLSWNPFKRDKCMRSNRYYLRES